MGLDRAPRWLKLLNKKSHVKQLGKVHSIARSDADVEFLQIYNENYDASLIHGNITWKTQMGRG